MAFWSLWIQSTEQKCFKAVLKEMTNSIACMCAGSWFHASGPATANEWVPGLWWLSWWRGRCEWHIATSVCSQLICLFNTSAGYNGVRPCSALNVSRHNLSWTCCGTGHRFLVPTYNQSCCCVQHRLQVVKLIPWSSGQQAITVVNSGDDEAVDYDWLVGAIVFRKSALLWFLFDGE